MDDNTREQDRSETSSIRVRKHQRFDETFKREAVRLSQLPGRTVASTARSLGIDQNTLGLWRKKYGEAVSTRTASEPLKSESDRAHEKDRELIDLRRRLLEAEQERDILKKAMGVISRPSR